MAQYMLDENEYKIYLMNKEKFETLEYTMNEDIKKNIYPNYFAVALITSIIWIMIIGLYINTAW
ncbi:MAG: hypothetical protein [Siphoviridae sp. ctjeG17]|nr:MAG: hypothetical protein [Siphoviridae sp. ctjeG17]